MAQASAPHPSHEDITAALRALAARWADAKARERGNFQLYMGELCSALGVEGPRPAGSGYEYELPVKIIDRNGKESSNFIDLFKRDHFILSARGMHHMTPSFLGLDFGMRRDDIRRRFGEPDEVFRKHTTGAIRHGGIDRYFMRDVCVALRYAIWGQLEVIGFERPERRK